MHTIQYIKYVYRNGAIEIYKDCDVDITKNSIIIYDDDRVITKYYEDLKSYEVGLATITDIGERCNMYLNLGGKATIISELKRICDTIKNAKIDLSKVLPIFRNPLDDGQNWYVLDNYIIDNDSKMIKIEYRLLESSQKYPNGDLKRLEIDCERIYEIPDEYNNYSISISFSDAFIDMVGNTFILSRVTNYTDFEEKMNKQNRLLFEKSIFNEYDAIVEFYIVHRWKGELAYACR